MKKSTVMKNIFYSDSKTDPDYLSQCNSRTEEEYSFLIFFEVVIVNLLVW